MAENTHPENGRTEMHEVEKSRKYTYRKREAKTRPEHCIRENAQHGKWQKI